MAARETTARREREQALRAPSMTREERVDVAPRTSTPGTLLAPHRTVLLCPSVVQNTERHLP